MQEEEFKYDHKKTRVENWRAQFGELQEFNAITCIEVKRKDPIVEVVTKIKLLKTVYAARIEDQFEILGTAHMPFSVFILSQEQCDELAGIMMDEQDVDGIWRQMKDHLLLARCLATGDCSTLEKCTTFEYYKE